MKSAIQRLNEFMGYAPYLLIIFGFYRQCVSYISRINEPLLGMFEFRETQTAISAYWMTQGGPKIIYETPVLGAPYTIPFEFPFFQWFTAFLAWVSPLDIGSSARTISFLCFGLCLFLAYKIIRLLEFSRQTTILFMGLVCLSPLYLYWSATSMIESMALAFALAWLLTYLKFLHSSNYLYLVLSLIFGVMAALEKITSFPPVLLVGGILTLIHFYENWRENPNGLVEFFQRNILKAIFLLSTVIIPVIAVDIWVHFADTAKAQNSMGRTVTSEALRNFNFGTIEQRLRVDEWKNVIFGRSLDHILGTGWFVILLMAAAFLRSTKDLIAVGLCFSAYLIAPLLFWRLHIVHYYYQYANGIFLLFGTAVIFREGFKKQRAVTASALLIVSFLMTTTFTNVFQSYMTPSKSGIAKRTIPPGDWIQKNTSQDSALYVFGNDWSSHVHLYAKRKGIAAKRGLTYQQVDDMLTNISVHTGGKPLESILVCERVYRDWKDEGKTQSRIKRLEAFLATREFIQKFDRCSLYR